MSTTSRVSTPSSGRSREHTTPQDGSGAQLVATLETFQSCCCRTSRTLRRCLTEAKPCERSRSIENSRSSTATPPNLSRVAGARRARSDVHALGYVRPAVVDRLTYSSHTPSVSGMETALECPAARSVGSARTCHRGPSWDQAAPSVVHQLVKTQTKQPTASIHAHPIPMISAPAASPTVTRVLARAFSGMNAPSMGRTGTSALARIRKIAADTSPSAGTALKTAAVM